MEQKPASQLLIIFGASGDLTYRKLIPAVYDLYKNNQLEDNFAVLGVSRTAISDDDFRSKLKEGIEEFAQLDTDKADDFVKKLFYLPIDTFKQEDYVTLAKKIKELQKSQSLEDNILYYMSTPPKMFPVISENLKYAKLHAETKTTGFRRIIIEKPFGTDLKSALELNDVIKKVFHEKQVYRIDHYLGKETVQNLLVTRFSNAIFEPLWNRNFISHVEIISSENIGVGKRGGYYDQSGALRDMFQNHLLQLLALVAMEPPAVLEPDAIRNEIMKLMQSLRPFTDESVASNIIRGQYTGSKIRGEEVNAYRDEEGVPDTSRTETFLAAKLFIDNWRWSDVPFFVRTGKRLPTRVTEIVISFKPTPHHLFNEYGSEMMSSNRLIIRIQPDEGLLMNFGMKLPGAGYKVKNVGMDFHYHDLSSMYLPSAYERLLLDGMLGDQTLFSRGDIVAEAWKFVQPIIDSWKNRMELPLFGYPAGTWGPKEAEDLINIENFEWRYPCKNLSKSDEFCEL